MIKQLIAAAALVVATVPLVQTSAMAHHIDVYPAPVVAPAVPTVVAPIHRAVVRPLHVYHHPFYRVYPAYRIHIHH